MANDAAPFGNSSVAASSASTIPGGRLVTILLLRFRGERGGGNGDTREHTQRSFKRSHLVTTLKATGDEAARALLLDAADTCNAWYRRRE